MNSGLRPKAVTGSTQCRELDSLLALMGHREHKHMHVHINTAECCLNALGLSQEWQTSNTSVD